MLVFWQYRRLYDNYDILQEKNILEIVTEILSKIDLFLEINGFGINVLLLTLYPICRIILHSRL